MTSPKLCLINVVNKSFFAEDPPLNIIFLASYLIKNNILPRKNIFVVDAFIEDPVDAIRVYKPDIIGLSVMTPFFHTAKLKAIQMKRISQAPILIGGYHVTALPNYLTHPFDIGVIGEGEEILADLIEIWKRHRGFPEQELELTKGLVFIRQDGKRIVTDRRSVIPPSRFVPMDWSVIPKERVGHHIVAPVDNKPMLFKTTRIFTARGCPYNCSFCAHRIMATGVRFYPIEMVGDEIEYLYRKCGITNFQIMDDTFAVAKSRLKALISELERRNILGKVFFSYLFVRANLIDEEFAQLLKKFGAISVFFGVESGSPRVLSWLKDGPFSTRDVLRAAKLFNRYGIYFFASFMLFSPGETKSDLRMSLALAKNLSRLPNALMLGYSVTTPYPGTKLWNIAVNTGIIRPEKVDWREFLMFDIRTSTRKMTKVYFADHIKVIDRERYWSAFARAASELYQRFEALQGWDDGMHEVHRLNTAQMVSMAMHMRLRHLRNHPLYTMQKAAQKPKIVSKVLKDFGMMTHLVPN